MTATLESHDTALTTGTTVEICDAETDAVLGTAAIIEERDIPAIDGFGGREATTLVRTAGGLWYDAFTGDSVSLSANTYIQQR